MATTGVEGLGGNARTPRANAHDRVVARLRQEIISGWRAPGSVLNEVELAAEYSVSRNPIREALRSLEAEGFVRSRPGRSSLVSRFSEAESRGILEVRSILETHAAQAAATARTAEQMLRFDALLREADSALEEGDALTLTALNTEFHLLVARATGNEVLVDIVRDLMRKVEWMYTPMVGNRGSHSWAEHRQIVGALHAGDAASSARLMNDHICAASLDFTRKHPAAPEQVR